MDTTMEKTIQTQLIIEEKFEDYIRRSLNSRAGIRNVLVKFLNLKKEIQERGKVSKEIKELEDQIDEKVKLLLKEHKKHDQMISNIIERQFKMSGVFCEIVEEVINLMEE